MDVFVYSYRDSLDPIRSGLTYSIDKMKTNAYAAPYAVVFEQLREEHAVVHAIDLKLRDQRSEAQARVDAGGERLAAFANRLGKQVLVLTDENQQHPQYRLFFGEKTPGKVKRLLLAGKFECAGGWELALEKTEQDSLKPFGPELKPLLASALEAREARGEAENAMKQFREVGERAQFFDKVNATRKLVYGELGKLPFQHVGLPRSFASGFFTRRRSKKRPEGVEPTKASLVKDIEALKAEVAAKEQLFAELEAKEAKAQQREAEVKAQQVAIEELEKQAAEALAQVAAKKAKLAAIKSA